MDYRLDMDNFQELIVSNLELNFHEEIDLHKFCEIVVWTFHSHHHHHLMDVFSYLILELLCLVRNYLK
jgi:hypothetical protein